MIKRKLTTGDCEQVAEEEEEWWKEKGPERETED